ncbi:unnamed protein product, partial [marine sediment metagenome]
NRAMNYVHNVETTYSTRRRDPGVKLALKSVIPWEYSLPKYSDASGWRAPI